MDSLRASLKLHGRLWVKRCALKVDLRKAYDTVEWDFLIATLQMFGFPAMFIRWIEECVTSAHYSVVVNGGVHGFFAGARDCQPLLQRLTAASKGWEGVQISFAGRVQLIKSVLISFEVYWAMAFILPKGIIKEMIKRLRTFLWKGTSAYGYPKVAWEAVCRPTEEGGLGIKDILALKPCTDEPQGSLVLSFDGLLQNPKELLYPLARYHGRLSTLDKPWLHHIGGSCILCQDGVPETHDHLFFSCSFSRCFTIIRQQIPLPWPTGSGNMVFNGRHLDGVESMW
ncbi:hypothetical protein Sango_3080700 [Sesamum angolense]|uniref:Reverse transcriptase zinc-binding domain-containing protein n=1 Tax=Sesamum angolense TaxID=2727404 RepID=A0AAE1T9N4_9LAMI|nr:hypothetical protein Sango_3080700 [Sesamum angolense]